MKAPLNLIMQSWNKTPMQDKVFRETIPANGANLENRLFFGTLIVVVLLAAVLLWASVYKQAETPRLPSHLSNLATQLSIAADEITMLQEAGLISYAPRQTELKENRIEPFVSEQMLTVDSNCFLLIKQDIALRLIQLPEHQWIAQWQTLSAHHGERHDGEQHWHYDEMCLEQGEWLSVANSAH